MDFNELIGCQLINLDNEEMIVQNDNKQYVVDFTHGNIPSHEFEEMDIFSQNPSVADVDIERTIAGIDIERSDWTMSKMVITFKGLCKSFLGTATATIWFYNLQIKEEIIEV